MALHKHSLVSACAGALLVLLSFSSAQAQTATTTDAAQIQAEAAQQLKEVLDMYRSQIPSPQSIQTSGIERSIILKTSPETPGARETVSFTLSSVLTDMDRATIAWYQNGVLKESGKGKKTFSATTGDFGSTLTVSAVIYTAEGISATRRASFRPLDIEISWEADTYTPPFYKGKALPSAQSTVRLSARVIGSSSNQNAFIYRWKKETTSLPEVSGYGKSSVTLPKALGTSGTSFEVSVYASDGTFIGKERITIRPVAPTILFYEDRALEGIRYQSALSGSAVAAGNEFTVRVEPFFVSREDRANGRVLYQWNVDGSPIKTVATTVGDILGEYGVHRLTVINTSSNKDTVSVNFGMQNTASALQTGKRVLDIMLGGKDIAGASF